MDEWGGSETSNTHHRYSKTGELMDEWRQRMNGVVVVVIHITELMDEWSLY